MSSNPFTYHPELADFITPAEQSFFRDLTIAKIEAILLEKGLPTGWWHSDEDRNANRHKTLEHHRGDDLWVFAYGSLMWDPAIQFAEVRRAHVQGFQRRFILKDIHGGRGTKESPGLMAALDHGGTCDGLAFLIKQDVLDHETDILWRREGMTPAYLPQYVDTQIGADTVKALTFVADHAADLIEPELTIEDQLDYFANGVGFFGSSADYLRNIAAQFDRLGIEDQDVQDMRKALDRRTTATR